VPKSRTRSKAVYTPPPSRAKAKVSHLPVESLGAWNLAIGFALIIGGVGLSTKWR
jgi:Cell division protein CrgA